MRLIELTCEVCKKSFERKLSEYKRNTRKNRKIYCSLVCSGKNHTKHLEKNSELNREKGLNQIQVLIKNGTYKKDKYSPFRYFLRKAKDRKKNEPTDLTLEYLHNLWEKQSGKCAITRISLGRYYPNQRNMLITASLDRIDSSLGYVKGNVQFVSMGINLAKNDFSMLDIMMFVQLIRES